MSIRAKLNLLVVTAVVLALGPFAAYSLSVSSDAAMDAAKADLRLIGVVASDAVRDGYLDYLDSQVRASTATKAALREAQRQLHWLRGDLAALAPEAAAPILARLRSEWRRREVSMLLIDRLGRPIGEGIGGGPGTGGGPDAADSPDPEEAGAAPDLSSAKDVTGELLTDRMAAGGFPQEGEFFVLTSPARDDASSPWAMLALVRPEGEAFEVFLASLDDVLSWASISESAIARRLEDRLNEVDLPPGGSLIALDDDRSILASKGDPPDLAPIGDDLLERARREGALEAVVDFPAPTGAILVRLEPFKPMGWTLALLAPQSELTGPARRMAVSVAVWAVLGAAVACALSAVFARRLSAPIEALAERAAEASGLDFSSPEAAAFFEAGRPPRSDELDRLAEAFDSMGRTIVANVGDLLVQAGVRERLDGELAAARGIQLGILQPPGVADLGGGLTAAAIIEPAREVGGDLFDYFAAPDGRVALVMGDVSGKGVPAALFMSMTVTLVRQTLIDARLPPAEAVTSVNRRLAAHNPSSMFVTLFVGLLDPATGELEYANGGHCPPLAAGPAGLRTLDGLSGPMVGYVDGLPYKGFRDRLGPGEILLLYTDGVTEAEDPARAFFGAERLERAALGGAEGGPEALVGAVLSAVAAFRGEAEPSDDVALLACGPGPAGPAPPGP